MKTEDFDSHATWTTLDRLQAHLEGDLHPANDDDRYHIRRLHSMCEFADMLRDSDPILLESGALNDINSHLTQIVNALDTYVSNPSGNRQYLASAAGQVLNVLNSARQHFPLSLPDEAQRAAKAASTRYKNALDAEVERLVAQIDELKQQLADADDRHSGEQAAATERLDALKSQITSREQEIDALTLKLQGQIDQQRTSFEEEAEERAAAFRAAEGERAEAEAERQERARVAADRIREAQEAEAKSLLERLETYNTQAAALVDTTSRHAIAGDYGTWSSNQAKAAFGWTIATVLIGIATVAGLIYAIGSAADDSIQFTVYKTSISVIGLIVAGYCARQAAEHRREERTAKRLALDLAALEPFLEQIEDPTELRMEVARRVFAPEQQTEAEGSLRTKRGALSITELTQLIAAFRQQPPV